MGPPRTFVGFSSTDIREYHLMCAWKTHENIDFNFCDCQLGDPIDSNSESYIKRLCGQRLDMAGTYILLIGRDTWSKTTYVKWEVEVAIENECRLIGVNIDKWRLVNPTICPPFFRNVGAVFVPFSAPIINHALNDWQRPSPPIDDWHYFDRVYEKLGYTLSGNIATIPPKPNPYAR